MRAKLFKAAQAMLGSYTRAAVSMTADFTVFPLLHPRRALNLYGEIDDLDFYRRRRPIPSVPLGELFPDPTGRMSISLTRASVRAATGDTQIPDLYSVCYAVAATGARRIFEIGTFNGMSTLNLALNAPPGATVYTLDVPPSAVTAPSHDASPDDHRSVSLRTPGHLYRDFGVKDRTIVQLWGDSAAFDFTPYYGSIDLVYIDGGHSYSVVRSDTDAAFKLLRDGGTVLWHDYKDRNGVGPVIDEVAKTREVVHVPGTWLAYYRTK